MKKDPRRKCLRITVGSGRSKVTATFFNADYLSKDLTEGTKVMLSGEVGFFKGAMQLTHPDVSHPRLAGREATAAASRCKTIADASQAISGEVLMSAFERRFFPIYPASTKLQSWDIFACVRQVLEVLDPVADPLPAELLAGHDLVSEDRGAARDPSGRETRPSAGVPASG